MLGGNRRKMMKNQGVNQMRGQQQQQRRFNQNFQNPNQFSDFPGYMDFDFTANNFSDQQLQQNQQQQGPRNMSNNMNRKNLKNNLTNKKFQNGGSNSNRMMNNKNNFQNAGQKNWNTNNQPQRPSSMMNQQFPHFNPAPPMMSNQRMGQNSNNNNNNFRSMRNVRNNNGHMQSAGTFGGNQSGPSPRRLMSPQNMPPMAAEMLPMQQGRQQPQIMRRQFQSKFNGNKQPNRKNSGLTKVDKPKNRKPQNLNKNIGTRGKKRQPRDPYSLTAPFVTDEIREEHQKKEQITEELKGKGKNDELFAKFKEQRDIFVKKYDEAKSVWQAEKKAQREAAKIAAVAAAAQNAEKNDETKPTESEPTSNINATAAIATDEVLEANVVESKSEESETSTATVETEQTSCVDEPADVSASTTEQQQMVVASS